MAGEHPSGRVVRERPAMPESILVIACGALAREIDALRRRWGWSHLHLKCLPAELATAEPGTFYLTDFLARHFDRFVIKLLGLDQHPELRDAYFGHYRKLVYLSQTEEARLLDSAARAAARLELDFEQVRYGYGELETGLAARFGVQENGQESRHLLA